MKTLLSTIVDNINYGTYLQAYATVKLLKDYGCDVDILNYIRPHLSYKLSNNISRIHNISQLIKVPLEILLSSYMRWNVKKFLSQRGHLTKQFTNWSKYKSKLDKYDLYLTGSDQVWNTNHNHGIDELFFWGDIDGEKRAYAASIGMDSFPDNQKDKIKRLLETYSFISLRENKGVEILSNLGFNNVSQVLDPTLMLDKNDWENTIVNKYKKTEDYLLVYSVETKRDLDTIEIARKIADEKNLKVYVVSPYIKFKSKLNVDRVFPLADTETFLNLFLNADYAVVSSFHGTAFAINFNVPFVTVSPDRFSSRVKSILQLVEIEDRYINNSIDIPSIGIDFKKVNSILDIERKKSSEILQKLLNL